MVSWRLSRFFFASSSVLSNITAGSLRCTPAEGALAVASSGGRPGGRFTTLKGRCSKHRHRLRSIDRLQRGETSHALVIRRVEIVRRMHLTVSQAVARLPFPV